MQKWFVTSGKIDEIVEASDQWDAFDSLRDRAVGDFGLVVEAQPVNETVDGSIVTRTSMLLGRWGRDDEARRFIKAVVAQGGPDTTATDIR